MIELSTGTKEFELVIIKAENIINNQKLKIKELTLNNNEKTKMLKLYKNKIVEYEKELKLYTSTSKDAEFVISKDQFLQIEDQLEKYQKEIIELKKINNELVTNTVLTKAVEKELNVDKKKPDDGSIVKLFRETYKKITKS